MLATRSLQLITLLLLQSLLWGVNARRHPSHKPCDDDKSDWDSGEIQTLSLASSTAQAGPIHFEPSLKPPENINAQLSSSPGSSLRPTRSSSTTVARSPETHSLISASTSKVRHSRLSYSQTPSTGLSSKSNASSIGTKSSLKPSTTTRVQVSTSETSVIVPPATSTKQNLPRITSVIPTTSKLASSVYSPPSIASTTVISASNTYAVDLPAEFTPISATPTGYSYYKDSAHFRVYATETDPVDETLSMLEGQYDCFVNRLNWRSSGLTFFDANGTGPAYKTNIMAVADLGGSAGVQGTDWNLGVAYVNVVTRWLSSAGVTCHEFGHALHWHQKTWVGQARTGAWWESVANWVADTYQTSDLCSASREAVGRKPGASMINLGKVIGDSFQVIVDGSSGTGNYYQAWPFLTYMTNNPDEYEGLGADLVHQLMVQYAIDSNEDPLHTLARVAGVPVATIVGRYWARMAYVDIGNAAAKTVFDNTRGGLNYVNVQQQGQNAYKVLEARKPRYMGANIIPLNTTGSARLQADVVADGDCTATLVIRKKGSGAARYLDIAGGTQAADIASDEEASLVVANTPKTLILYNAFALTADVQAGLDYSFTLTGATVAGVALAPAA